MTPQQAAERSRWYRARAPSEEIRHTEDHTRSTQHGGEEDREHADVPGVDPGTGGDHHGGDETEPSEDELPPCRRRRGRRDAPRL